MFLAPEMLAIFYIFYIYVTRLPVTILTMAIYGVLLDLLFRVTMVYQWTCEKTWKIQTKIFENLIKI